MGSHQNAAEPNNCVPNMSDVMNASQKAGLRVFYARHHRYRPGDYETWNTLRPFRRQRGRERHSKTARGVARSALNSRLSQATLWLRSTRVQAGLLSPTWICSLKSIAFITLSSFVQWTDAADAAALRAINKKPLARASFSSDVS